MTHTPPKFDFRNISKWRCIDLSTTKSIAHMCCSGVDFSGCSKSMVIECIARPTSYTSDAPKFVALMDAAAKFLPRMKADYKCSILAKIKAYAKKFDEPKF